MRMDTQPAAPFALLIAAAAAQAPVGSVQGLVVDALQQPQPAAEVELEADGVVVARTHSDATGWFVFPRQSQPPRVVHARLPGRAAGAAVLDILCCGDAFATVALAPTR